MKFLKYKITVIITAIILLIACGAGVTLSTTLPDTLVICDSERNGNWLPQGCKWFVSARENRVNSVVSNTAKRISHTEPAPEQYSVDVLLCGIIPVKKVDVSVVKDFKVIPGGDSMGINLKTDGVLVVGISGFRNEKDEYVSPGKNAGIRVGDIITSINHSKINKISELSDCIADAGTDIYIEGKRNNNPINWNLEVQKDKNDEKKKIGIWVRDSIAGIGTLTFYYQNSFAALGHPICDIDTGKNVPISGGSVSHASVIGVDKGSKGTPGSLKGIFTGVDTGKITANSYCGIYGKAFSVPTQDRIPIAMKKEVKTGKAQIICSVSGQQKQKYSIEILRVVSTSDDTKGMVIEITDKKLLSKTGGIVQGMSGSPILQNGKLVGAVTHVFINEPSRGYAVFAETMIKELIVQNG